MTTAEFIKRLQAADPSGEAHVRMDGGIPVHFELKAGYWDGPYSYINEDGKWVYTSINNKVDIYCMDKLEFVDENIIENWNPFTESEEGLWEKAKEQFVFELGNYSIKEQQQERIDSFFHSIEQDFNNAVKYRKEQWLKYLNFVISLHKRGCRFFRKKEVRWDYYNQWKWVNEKDPKDIGMANLMHTYPILKSGKFIPIETDVFPNNEYYEYVLKN